MGVFDCDHVQMFWHCKLNDTPLDAREKFGIERGKPVSQEDIRDENGFVLNNDLLN